MGKKTYLISIILIFVGCQKAKKPDIIIDPYFSIPFEIIRPVFIVPDSIGGQSIHGKIVTSIEIDSMSVVSDIKIMYLNLKNNTNQESIIYRYSENQLTDNVVKYIVWIKKTFAKLVIVKKPGYNGNLLSKYYIGYNITLPDTLRIRLEQIPDGL